MPMQQPVGSCQVGCSTDGASSEMETKSPSGVGKFITLTDNKTIAMVPAPHMPSSVEGAR